MSLIGLYFMGYSIIKLLCHVKIVLINITIYCVCSGQLMVDYFQICFVVFLSWAHF